MAPRTSGISARDPNSWWMCSTWVKTRRISIMKKNLAFRYANTEPTASGSAMSSDFEHKGSTRRHCPWQTSRTAHTSPLFCSARAHPPPPPLPLANEQNGPHEPPFLQRAGARRARIECMVHLRGRQRRHVDGDEGVAGVAVVLAGAGGQALDGGVGHVDGVGDSGGGGISPRRGGGRGGRGGRARATVLAITVAAASACAAVAANTVTLSAMPSEKLRPRQPLVATPRTGWSACSSNWPSVVSMPLSRQSKRARSANKPTRAVWPGARCSAMSPPLLIQARSMPGRS